MKRQEEYDPAYVHWIENNPNYILEPFEGIKKKNSRIVLLVLLVLVMLNYLVFIADM
jgi:hypothetical protein